MNIRRVLGIAGLALCTSGALAQAQAIIPGPGQHKDAGKVFGCGGPFTPGQNRPLGNGPSAPPPYTASSNNAIGQVYAGRYGVEPRPGPSIPGTAAAPAPVLGCLAGLSGSLSNKIFTASQHFYGYPSYTIPNTGNPAGTEACAAMVNLILNSVLGHMLVGGTHYVPDIAAYFRTGGAVQVGFMQAQPGDIVIASNEGHIGIYQGNGVVLSNSSSHGHFIWRSDINFTPSYRGPSTIWHMNNG